MDAKKNIYNFCTAQSLVHAADNERLTQDKRSQESWCWGRKFAYGVFAGVRAYTVAYSLNLLFSKIVAARVTETVAKPQIRRNPLPPFVKAVVLAPIIEEILFRGIGQNLVKVGQKLAKRCAPESWKGNRAFKWLSSPSARILAVNSIFAYTHYRINQRWLGRRGAAIQSLQVFLTPAASTLHETTNNLIAPYGMHVTFNAIGWLLKRRALAA